MATKNRQFLFKTPKMKFDKNYILIFSHGVLIFCIKQIRTYQMLQFCDKWHFWDHMTSFCDLDVSPVVIPYSNLS